LNYQVVFILSFVGGVSGIYFFALMRIPDNRPVERVKLDKVPFRQRLRAYLRTFGTPAFLRYELTTFVLRFGLNLPTALYSIYWIRHLNASDLWIGWQATVGNLVPIVGYFVWGRIIGRRGHYLPLLICTVGVGLYPALMGLVTDQAWLPAIAIVQGFFVTGVNLSVFDTLFAVCPAEKRPSFIALNTMLASLVIFLAPMAGSLLVGWMDIRSVFFIAGGIHLVAALLFWRFRIGAEPKPGP
jgi:MFS family permease